MATHDKDGRSTRGGTHEQHVEAGRKGGVTVSQNRQHMAEIGRRGGEAVSQNRHHMAEIGRLGGQRSHGGTHEQHVEAGRKGGEARQAASQAHSTRDSAHLKRSGNPRLRAEHGNR